MTVDTGLYILAAILIIAGILGTILPALPGLPLMFIGMLLAAWVDDFQRIEIWVLVVLGLLTAVSFLVDFAATAMGAKKVGASRMAIAGAMIGMVVGLFMGIVGVFIVPFIGAVIGEMLHRRQWSREQWSREHVSESAKVGLGTWLGIVLGIVLKLGLAFTMLGVFVVAWYV